MIAGRFLLAFNEFVAIKFLFSNLINIKGYSYGDVLLCFSIMQMSFTLISQNNYTQVEAKS